MDYSWILCIPQLTFSFFCFLCIVSSFINRPGANAGRSFDESVDLTKALENCYNPEQALKKSRRLANG
jgi:hypothetical protein